MNGRRAKILRKWAGYDMREERKKGRQYGMQPHYWDVNGKIIRRPFGANAKPVYGMFICRGERGWYKELKKRIRRRRLLSRI